MTDSADMIVFYERDTGMPLALWAGNRVCRYGDPQYSLEEFRADLEADGFEVRTFILVDLADAFELDSVLEDLSGGQPSKVSFLGPFPIAMLGGNVPTSFVGDPPDGLPN